MRWMLLAVALVVAGASPALAQKVYGNRTPMHRATYAAQEGKSPVKYAGVVHHQEEVVGEPVASGCSTCASNGGCNSCGSRHCRMPPLFPCLADNVADLFVRFKPCPSKCSPCVRTVHCCPYPKQAPPSFCCRPRLPGLLDSIFVCNKGCAKKGCGCVSESCATGGCTSCATGHAVPSELIAPPTPLPEMQESPFKDDPAQAKRKTPNKTAATPRHWYKTSRPAPIRAAETPDTIVFGSALPINGAQRE